MRPIECSLADASGIIRYRFECRQSGRMFSGRATIVLPLGKNNDASTHLSGDTPTEYREILYPKADGIATITINRPSSSTPSPPTPARER